MIVLIIPYIASPLLFVMKNELTLNNCVRASLNLLAYPQSKITKVDVFSQLIYYI